MGIFASETTETIPIPFDLPNTVTVQKLTGRDLERAASAHQDAFATGRRPRGWPAYFQRVLAEGVATARDAEQAVLDPLAGYDRLVVAQAGVKAWSYTVVNEKGETVPRPVTAAAVADLDDDALEFFAIAVMRLTKPSLFQTAEEAKASRKND